VVLDITEGYSAHMAPGDHNIGHIWNQFQDRMTLNDDALGRPIHISDEEKIDLSASK